MRHIVSFPTSVYWDWMHCVVASGGIAQYELNQLVLSICGSGIPIEQLDEFAATIQWPHASAKLPKHFSAIELFGAKDRTSRHSLPKH